MKKKIIKNNNNNKYRKLLTLRGAHTPLTGISTPHLHCGTPVVLSLLLSFSPLGGPLFLLVSSGDLLAFGSYNLRFFSPLQQGSFFLQHLVLELLDILQLLLLLCNPPFFCLFFGFDLYFSPGFLSCTLCMTGLCCLLQSKERLLLLLMPSLYLTALLLEHFSIVLRNVRGSGERHDNTETRVKNFFFHLCIVDLGTITGLLDKLNRTLKAQS